MMTTNSTDIETKKTFAWNQRNSCRYNYGSGYKLVLWHIESEDSHVRLYEITQKKPQNWTKTHQCKGCIELFVLYWKV